MNRALAQAIAAGFAAHPELDDVAPQQLSTEGMAGGCISAASRLDTPIGEFFLKTNARGNSAMFDAEARGLVALRAAKAIRVPRPLIVGVPSVADVHVLRVGATGDDAKIGASFAEEVAFVPSATGFVVMEYIAATRPAASFAERFGAELASLHTSTTEAFGFAHDNFIGATPQPNGWMSDWVEFYAVRRIEHQVMLARNAGRADSELPRLADRLCEKLDRYIGDPNEPPALLHGDLWSGNYLAGPNSEPAIIDPAVYYGRREADIAMTELFGGFPADFYAAYDDAWPRPDGYNVRRDIYNLYHLLNHWNLFGGGYESQAVSLLRRYAG